MRKATPVSGFGAALVSDTARFTAFGGFVLLVALMGGSSRSDVVLLVVLRPVAVLLFAYAVLAAQAGQLRAVRGPLLVVSALMVLALLQLVPLPVSVWSALPHREVVAEASALAGLGDVARPLSLDPNRTWNTFFSLFVPLATICLVAVQAPVCRHRIIPLLLAAGLCSAALGFLQAVGGGGFYLYEITHRGFPVGLFANKNHQSIMLLWSMLAGSWLAARTAGEKHSSKAVVGAAFALVLILLPLLILTGSRAGLLLALPVLLLCGWLLLGTPAMKGIIRKATGRAKLVIAGAVAAMAAPLLFVFGVLAMSDRQSALTRLFEEDAGGDLRWSYLPIFPRMVSDFLPFGSGFGSFERVFDMYEPADMLTSRYMNQAHNDPLQILIEGSLPAAAVVVVGLAWLGHRLWIVWRRGGEGRPAAVFHGGSIGIWLAASVVDYPLRTPFGALLVAALTAHLCFLSTAARVPPTVGEGRRAG